MKVSELRVGNYVDYFSENTDRWIHGRQISSNDLMCLLDGESDHADEILLNENWLFELGFKNSASIGKSDSFYFIYVGASELHINPINGVVWIERNENIFNNPALVTHVHQLQNLYFALTGQELTIKELAQ